MNPSPYTPPFNSAHGRARIVKILLIVGAIAAVVSLCVEAVSLALPPITEEEDFSGNPAGAAVVLIIVLLASFEVLIYVATVIFFLLWLYRAHDNLRALNPRSRLDHSPGWAVGSFFIPFVNLVVPYRAVREVWQNSGPPDETMFGLPNPPGVFPLWWTFWLLASFAGNISMRVSFNENIDQSTSTMVSMIAGVLSIVAAIFAYLVVDEIDKRQEESSSKLRIGSFAGPPPPPPAFPADVAFSPSSSPQS